MNRAKRRTLTAIAVLTAGIAIATPTFAATSGSDDERGSDPKEGYPCNSNAPHDYTQDDAKVLDDYTGMRTGTGASCIAPGDMQRGEKMDVHCSVYAPSNGHIWTYGRARLQNRPWPEKGWVRSDHLGGYDKSIACPAPFIARHWPQDELGPAAIRGYRARKPVTD